MSLYEDAIQSMLNKNNHLDLDLPNFTPTKYNKCCWKFLHFFLYFMFGICYLLSEIYSLKKSEKSFINDILFSIGSLCYLISSLIEWSHFKRGCCGQSNLNNQIKKNIDQSFMSKMKRSEIGVKYFFNILVSMILLISYTLKIIFKDKDLYKQLFPIFVLLGMSLLVITEIFKIEKTLTNTKQYRVKNDISNSMVEITNFIGALLYFTGNLIIISYKNNEKDKINFFVSVINLIGTVFFVVSSFILFYRYFLSGFDDLNVSESSFMTIAYEI